MRLFRAIIGCVAITLVGCYGPSFQEGLPCSVAGECPGGYTCATDNKCYAEEPEFVSDAGVDSEPQPPADASDTQPPEAIADLSVDTVTTSAVELSWTAPATAASYDIRYSTSIITTGNWASATVVDAEFAPQSPKSRESFTVTDLGAGATYYFAVRSTDDVGNRSDLSNVAAGATVTPPPPSYVGPAVTRKEIDLGDTVDFGYTVPTGANRLLVVVATAEGDTDCDPVAPSTINYGGLPLAKLVEATRADDAHVSMWYLIAPVSGVAQVVATWPCIGGDYAATAVSYAGVHQAVPFGPPSSNIGTGGIASILVTSAAAELVIDSGIFRFGAGTSPPLQDTGQFLRVLAMAPEDDAGATWTRTTVSEAAGDPAGVNMSWSIADPSHWALVGVSLKPALD